MPMLTPSQVHLDVPLTNLTIAYAQEMTNFVADKVFGTVSVDKQSNKFYKYDREGLRHGDVKLLAPRTEVDRVGMSLSNDNYFAEVRGIGMDFDEQELANEDTMLEFRSQGANVLMEKVLIDREVRWADTFFKTGVWGTETTPANLWSDYRTSTPIVDVTNARREMQLKSGGFRPNKMLISREVMDVLIDHPDIISRISGGATTGSPALLNKEMLARVFAVDEVLVAEGIENTAAEGATESNAFLAGKQVALYYAPTAPGLMVPAAGYNFTWTASELNASGFGTNILSFSDDALKRRGVAEQLQIKMSWDAKVVSADMGVFFNSIIA